MRIETVLEGNLCAGCGLCASVMGPERAEMHLTADGFLRPRFHSSPTPPEAGVMAETCPGGRLNQQLTGHQPVWGPSRDVLSGHATDSELRFSASSGGALSALLVHLLATGRADYVLQVGADGAAPWRNRVVETRTREDVMQNSGSRYAPSAPLADIVQRLDRAERFVVVAKPCDIAGLRAYARRDERVDQRVVMMISFFCAGVPSETGAKEILAEMGVDPASVNAFRYRGNGWPGATRATTVEGIDRDMTYADSWGRILSRHVQTRCKVCPDGLGAFADVVCADAWLLAPSGGPSFEEAEGRSLIMSRTERGAELVADARASGELAAHEYEIAALEVIQRHQARRTRLTLSRMAALAATRRPVPRFHGLRLGQAALQAGALANVKSFLGAVARIRRRSL